MLQNQNTETRLNNLENMMLLNTKSVLNFNDVAVYTGLSKSHLYKLTSTRGIPCYKPNGKHIYFSKNEIDNWLLQNRKATNLEIEKSASNYVALNSRGTK
ncbi:MAG: helix-turn-helix domain-containing protein [Candidatus Kapabacteria bacterium]|nr:helix-turn-helix domain-containing protein [Candidatus Kapabacteria bacterium]